MIPIDEPTSDNYDIIQTRSNFIEKSVLLEGLTSEEVHEIKKNILMIIWPY